VYLEACQCCASSRDWASRITRSSCLLIQRLTFSENSHDWGSAIAYEAARERPDVFTAVIGISAPYDAAVGPYTPITALALLIPHFAYQVYFAEQTSAAIAELNTDIRRTLRSTLRTAASPPPSDFLTSNSSYLDAWKNVSTVGLKMMSIMSP
jgi:pimeloyl-ACP methyl ester carboxylesterase